MSHGPDTPSFASPRLPLSAPVSSRRRPDSPYRRLCDGTPAPAVHPSFPTLGHEATSSRGTPGLGVGREGRRAGHAGGPEGRVTSGVRTTPRAIRPRTREDGRRGGPRRRRRGRGARSRRRGDTPALHPSGVDVRRRRIPFQLRRGRPRLERSLSVSAPRQTFTSFYLSAPAGLAPSPFFPVPSVPELVTSGSLRPIINYSWERSCGRYPRRSIYDGGGSRGL